MIRYQFFILDVSHSIGYVVDDSNAVATLKLADEFEPLVFTAVTIMVYVVDSDNPVKIAVLLAKPLSVAAVVDTPLSV